MKSTIMKLLDKKYGTMRSNKKRIELEKLEQDLLVFYKTPEEYSRAGGFQTLAAGIGELVSDGYLKPIGNKFYSQT